MNMRRPPIKQHKDLLTDLRYKQRIEKTKKAILNEIEKEEAEKDIRTYIYKKGREEET